MKKSQNRFMTHGIYQKVINKNNFLVKMEEIFDWYELARPLLNMARNSGGGHPRYPIDMMLKILFLSFLFNLSDRETEDLATNNLTVKYFLNLPIDARGPDHTSICDFRNECLRKRGHNVFNKIFKEVIKQAKEKGIKPSTINALDATHSFANVDTSKKQDPDSPIDPDASWGCKGTEIKIDKNSNKVEVQKLFYGYKAHFLTDSEYGLITAIHATPGNIADIDAGDDLIHKILQGYERKNIKVLLADKGYGSAIWINLLEKYTGIMTAFALPDTLTKKNRNKEKWQKYQKDEGRKAFAKDRYIVERVNADCKNNHGLGKCRYRGLDKYQFQVAMTSMAHNIKVFVKILTGVGFKPA